MKNYRLIPLFAPVKSSCTIPLINRKMPPTVEGLNLCSCPSSIDAALALTSFSMPTFQDILPSLYVLPAQQCCRPDPQ